MRDDLEERGFNPVKFGIIGALLIAIVVAGVLVYRAFASNKLVLSETTQQLEKIYQEKDQLQEKITEIEADSKEASEKSRKILQQRESQLSSLKRQKDSDERVALSEIAGLKKEKTELETRLARTKKESDAENKRHQDQLMKVQRDLQKARSDAERYSKSYNTLKQKLDKIAEGDQAAADRMVQELAAARQALKREQSIRRQLEEELEALRQQMQSSQ